MTLVWVLIGFVVIGAAALVLIAGALLVAVMIDGALNNDGNDEY